MSDAMVATATEGLSFDDVATGEIDVRRVQVKTKPEKPDPVPFGEVADLTWRMPSVLPRRGVPVLMVAAVGSGGLVAVLLVGTVVAAVGGVL